MHLGQLYQLVLTIDSTETSQRAAVIATWNMSFVSRLLQVETNRFPPVFFSERDCRGCSRSKTASEQAGRRPGQTDGGSPINAHIVAKLEVKWAASHSIQQGACHRSQDEGQGLLVLIHLDPCSSASDVPWGRSLLTVLASHFTLHLPTHSPNTDCASQYVCDEGRSAPPYS